ncbi:NDUV3 dehydrogenase, partial [Atlantisia rogersi]|nr:NDUV3 dehydrogenase [Atlantisia rogersi]
MCMSRKTVVAFPQRAVVSTLEEENVTSATEGGLRKELGEEETSSSSSSDSSSDSEEETEDSEVAVKTKVEFPKQDSIFSENIAVKASLLAKESLPQKSHKAYVAKKSRKKETDVSSVKQAAFSKASVKQETPKSKARDPKVKTAPKEADHQKLVLKPHVVERQDLTDVTHRSDYLEEKSIGTQVAALQLKASSVPREGKKEKLVFSREEKMVKQESEAEEGKAPKLEETSESTVVVMGTTAKEETIQEAGVQAGERSTIEAAAEPAPEEFDNSTYKNLQHHDYNIYTFADYVAVLSKFRQPQPSSGRPSPRH